MSIIYSVVILLVLSVLIFVAGILFERNVITKKLGNFVINLNDPNKDVFRVDFTEDPEYAFHKKRISFTVICQKNEAYNGTK